MDWSRVLDTVLHHLGVFIWLGIGLGVILSWSSKELLQQLGLAEFVDKWRPWISLTFLVSSLLGLRILKQEAAAFLHKRRLQTEIIEDFINLPQAERTIVRYAIQRDADAVWLPYHDPAVMSLRAKGILELVSNQLPVMKEWNFQQCCLCRLTPSVKKLLHTVQEMPHDETDQR